MTNSIKHIGDKLVVGELDVSFLDVGSRLLPGTSVLNGPVYIGLVASAVIPRANCMMGPGITSPKTLEVVGVSDIIGITNVTGVVNRFAFTTAKGATIKLGVSIKKALGASLGLSTKAAKQLTHGKKICSAGIVTPSIKAGLGKFVTCKADLGVFKAVAAPFKKFDIPHPSKPGYRLTHTCIEGPEIGVYYRGKLKNCNVIELPDYWKNLIDPETITVHLTPHTFHQELYVKDIQWGSRINIINNSGGNIDCSYIVYAERIDVEKLVVEYEEKKSDFCPEKNN